MAQLESDHAVYVGSFDPLTLGHLDIVRRGASVFRRLTVGIGINPEKHALFSPEERLAMATQVFGGIDNVAVTTFTGLAVEFVRSVGSRVLLRGVRTLTDIDSEFTMSLANTSLDPEIESVFLMTGGHFAHISSSLIKQIAAMGRSDVGDRLKEFVPEPVIPHLLGKLSGK